ncbi:MAG: phosphoribosylglycinamide formyltransferase [Candidatus Competibacterales bacterium]
MAVAFNLVVLVSGRGSNLQAILDAIARGELAAKVAAVISNDPQAQALERASRAGLPVAVVDHRTFARRRDFDAALAEVIDDYAPQLIPLAGFMRRLDADFVQRYWGRLINIHPSLLPRFKGLNTHARVLAAGEREHGVSVHFVTPELDGGPVIARARVAVRPDDDPPRLAARVLSQEHQLYPAVLSWFAAGRVSLAADHRVWWDGAPLAAPREPLSPLP